MRTVDRGNSLDQILSHVPTGWTEPNDVIATVNSQFDRHASLSRLMPLAIPNLEHTASATNWMAEALSIANLPFQDTNVTNSNVVRAAILCALISSGGNPVCVLLSTSGSEVGREAPLTEFSQVEEAGSARSIFLSPGRLDILPPSEPLKLAEENAISLQSHEPGLNKLEIQQVQSSPGGTRPHGTHHFTEPGWAMLPVLHHADGSAYMNVIPRVFGQVVLQTVARLPDGSETHTEAPLNVRPPDRSPEKIIVGDLGSTRSIPVMDLYLKPHPRLRVPGIRAIYEKEGERFQINPSFVSIKMRTANATPIIELDKTTGLITPVHPGEALLETSFQGWSNLTCICVEDKFNPNPGPRPRCQSLLLPGEESSGLISRRMSMEAERVVLHQYIVAELALGCLPGARYEGLSRGSLKTHTTAAPGDSIILPGRRYSLTLSPT